MNAVSPRGPGAPPVKRDAAMAVVRAMIADGTLNPGDLAPSGPELAGKAGCHLMTAQAALRALAADGTLTRGATGRGRPYVAGPSPAPRAPLARMLAESRRAADLRPAGLAVLLGVPLAAVRQAEAGRAWHKREFWERAGAVLGDEGRLARAYDECRAAAGLPAPALPAVNVTADCVTVTWLDGTQTLARPPGLT